MRTFPSPAQVSYAVGTNLREREWTKRNAECEIIPNDGLLACLPGAQLLRHPRALRRPSGRSSKYHPQYPVRSPGHGVQLRPWAEAGKGDPDQNLAGQSNRVGHLLDDHRPRSENDLPHITSSQEAGGMPGWVSPRRGSKRCAGRRTHPTLREASRGANRPSTPGGRPPGCAPDRSPPRHWSPA